MKTKLFAWVSWIPFLVSAAAEWGFDFDLPLTPALWLVMAAVVFFASNAPAALTTNSWTDGNGKWELGLNWDHGVPALSNSANVIRSTGPAFSTLTPSIDGVTVASNGLNGCLTISNLTLSVVNSLASETLLLTNATLLTTPLKIIDTLTIGIHTSVIVSNAALQIGATSAGTVSDDGTVTLYAGTIIATNVGTTFAIGDNGAGRLTVLGGTWQARSAYVGNNVGSQGTLTMAGGTNLLTVFEIGVSSGAAGAVWLTGGQLTITNTDVTIPTYVGKSGVGRMTVSNGTWLVRVIDVGAGAGSQGTLTIAGGTTSMPDPIVGPSITVGQDSGATGTVWVTGGHLTATNDSTIVGDSGVGRMVVSNGTVQLQVVALGFGSTTSQGTLEIAGGTNVIRSLLIFGQSNTALNVTGGRLVMNGGAISIARGQMMVSGGTVLGSNVTASFGTLTQSGGTEVFDGGIFLGPASTELGTMWLTGGDLVTTNLPSRIGNQGIGMMTVSNGIWQSRDVKVGPDIINPSFNGQGTLVVAGGKSLIYSNMTLGNSCSDGTGIVNVVGGELHVTNSAVTATLRVASGTLTQSGGILEIDRLVIIDPCARFIHTGGTLVTGVVNLGPPGSGLDADGDGLPNDYEQANGLDPFNPADAVLDADGDGATNYEESQSGTDPHNSTSVFKVTSVDRLGNDIRVTWTTVTNKGYRVQASAGDVGGGFTNDFSNVSSLITATTSGESTTNYFDAGGATNKPVRYYRVRVVP